jgi:hypothetical protein
MDIRNKEKKAKVTPQVKETRNSGGMRRLVHHEPRTTPSPIVHDGLVDQQLLLMPSVSLSQVLPWLVVEKALT